MEKALEYLKFIFGQKNAISVALLFVITALAVIGVTQYIVPHTQNIIDLRKGNIEKQNELEQREIQLKAQQKEKQMKEQKKVDKVPVSIYKPTKPGTPIENSVVDLVTSVIQKLERANLSIVDVSYRAGTLRNASIPAGVDTIQLTLSLTGSYTALQDFIYEMYDDQYLSSIKLIKMSPLKENKTILEINTTIQLYVAN